MRFFAFAFRNLIRALGSVILFWVLHPLGLAVVWSLQGYLPSWLDLQRWYLPGVFIIVPAVGMGAGTLLFFPLLEWWASRVRVSRTRLRAVGGLVALLLFPPLSPVLLFAYAGMLPYWDWQVGGHYILRSYLETGLTSAVVGLLLGEFLPGKRLPVLPHVKILPKCNRCLL